MYTHENLLHFEKVVFTRKFDLFFDEKWLFCEENLKITYFGLRKVIFGTLGDGVFREGV